VLHTNSRVGTVSTLSRLGVFHPDLSFILFRAGWGHWNSAVKGEYKKWGNCLYFLSFSVHLSAPPSPVSPPPPPPERSRSSCSSMNAPVTERKTRQGPRKRPGRLKRVAPHVATAKNRNSVAFDVLRKKMINFLDITQLGSRSRWSCYKRSRKFKK
jgi:hypothetical protein